MPLLTEEAGLVSAPTVVLFSLLNETIFVSEILFQDLCSPSCWFVYHVFCVC